MTEADERARTEPAREVSDPAPTPPADASNVSSFPTSATPQLKVSPIAVPTRPIKLFNREFSWLEFNRRVLAEAANPDVPLLERVKFLSIAASNLDEFFMVRVASFRELLAARITERSPDGLTPKQQLKGIRDRVSELLLSIHKCLNESLIPELKKAGIRIQKFSELSKKEQLALKEYFTRQIAPILTPLAIDPGHPFPFLSNLALNMALILESAKGEEHLVIMKVPALVPRFIAVPDDPGRYVAIETLIAEQIAGLFPMLKLRKLVLFRVLRNADILLQEDEVQDLLQSIESEIRRRDRKEVVWVEISEGAEESVTNLLMKETRAGTDDIFFSPGLLKLSDLLQIYLESSKPSLKEVPFNPRIPSQLATSEDMFSIIRRGDVMLHRPYDSFSAVVEFVQAASEDPDVLAIKQTLYRTDEGSPIVEALAAAAQRGKQVTAVVELQARFDEQKNIAWGRKLEDAGVQVVYGLVGIKTHCKLCQVVRRDEGELRRYVHLSTGNYNARTARYYTDIDLFTCDESFGEDSSQLTNFLTGFSLATVQEVFDGIDSSLEWKRFIVSPMSYQRWTVEMIERETRHAKEGRPSQIVAKMNALVDPIVIQKLYDASEAGVKIELIVRGICCLVPGVEGLSKSIRVISIVDRFLEHSRLFVFRNGGNSEVFVSSGDWMPRNFLRRIELTYPILDPIIKMRLENQILGLLISDNVKAWRLQPDGSYRRYSKGDVAVRSQERFIEIARSEAVRLAPYEEMISKPAAFRRKVKKLKKSRSKGSTVR